MEMLHKGLQQRSGMLPWKPGATAKPLSDMHKNHNNLIGLNKMYFQRGQTINNQQSNSECTPQIPLSLLWECLNEAVRNTKVTCI